jgi:prepilin-type N-terminal cleavage/methylation domain-containing protein
MNKKAFTLVELIVVMTILAILATISFSAIQNYATDARDAKRISDTRNLLEKINIEQTI